MVHGRASMRPSDITDGIPGEQSRWYQPEVTSSMRPSDITDGIDGRPCASARHGRSFNEAVGYYRRNRPIRTLYGARLPSRFNEAVGYYRRNPHRPESRSSSLSRSLRFNEAVGYYRRNHVAGMAAPMDEGASMRPSDITDGIMRSGRSPTSTTSRFNEAVGYYRRNPARHAAPSVDSEDASMRPSDITDGIARSSRC